MQLDSTNCTMSARTRVFPFRSAEDLIARHSQEVVAKVNIKRGRFFSDDLSNHALTILEDHRLEAAYPSSRRLCQAGQARNHRQEEPRHESTASQTRIRPTVVCTASPALL